MDTSMSVFDAFVATQVGNTYTDISGANLIRSSCEEKLFDPSVDFTYSEAVTV